MTGSEQLSLPRLPFILLCCLGLLASGATFVFASAPPPELTMDHWSDPQTNLPVVTLSRFDKKIIDQSEPIPFSTHSTNDPNQDKCEPPRISQPGKNGKKIKKIEITYYDGEEWGRRVVDTIITSPTDEIQTIGTKTVYKTLSTSQGDISYTCKLGVFRATAYDKTCHGCDGRTAIGMNTGFGVVAVDPKVIPMRSRLYITGYGIAIAGDTGGAIKGKRVDLGFDSIDKSWGVRNVEVYIL